MTRFFLEDVEHVTVYTGTNGTEECTCRCPGCSQNWKKSSYQGTIQQARDMFDRLPNLKQLYILGNPDITVDTEFCHEVMKMAVDRNIRIECSTSGVGGIAVLEKLLKQIPPEMVNYISFSFDGTTKREMSFFKGINYPMEKALESLEWAMEQGYSVKVQPTLWACNYRKTRDIIDFFSSKGVRWFSFHVGSLEGGINLPSHQHLTPKQLKFVHDQISKAVKDTSIKVSCPLLFKECGANTETQSRCMNPSDCKFKMQITFAEEAIKITHTPLISGFRQDFMLDLNSFEKTDMTVFQKKHVCPFSEELSGRNDAGCRFVYKYWNYESSV